MSSRQVADSGARNAALDETQSFIVQAPAGSGKTELLSQRILKLLGRVEEPEQILAITFTRKAAGEMRRRVLQHLRDAENGVRHEEAHRRLSVELAEHALTRDRELGWCLLECPFRLRIMTIDSFNASLVRLMPLATGLPAQPQVIDDPRPLYEQAAETTLQCLGDSDDTATAAGRLLVHLDNSPERFVEMLADMLARRDHWLRHVVGTDRAEPEKLRARLEEELALTIDSAIRDAASTLRSDLGAEICVLAEIAARRLDENEVDHRLGVLAGLDGFPEPVAANLGQWRTIADFVLTNSGTARKTVNKNHGFPPDDAAAKQRMKDFLETLAAHEASVAALATIRALPPPHYTDRQWRTLAALLELLPVAAAQLVLLFDERAQTDFPGLAFAARQALGLPEEPEDLALLMDYRLQHILVDEFQDTSIGQVGLLSQLTAGWQVDDGRTIFCVGDPMQSIYRFRDAEVGLFLAATEGQLDLPPMETLRLSENFRSRSSLVNWFNKVFPSVLAADDDAVLGAVSYARSTHGGSDASSAPAVDLHPIVDKSGIDEAQCVADIVEAESQEPGISSCAILVRSRSHLAAIVPELRARNIAFEAVEIEALRSQPHICDLVALTRALAHRGDRTAWLAVMRAPFVGMTHTDMLAVAEAAPEGLPEILHADRLPDSVSDDGRARLLRLAKCFEVAECERGRRSLRRRVEGMWLSLGGAATLTSESAVEDVESYFELLGQVDVAGDLGDPDDLDRRLDGLFASADPVAATGLQIMTIHKAKGLEFDTVILPALHRKPRGEKRPLLRWMEISSEEGQARLLFAPNPAHGEETDALSEYLSNIEKGRSQHEAGRLTYVAATRARTRLHLVFGVDRDPEGDGLKAPVAGSLLSFLWSALQPEVDRLVRADASSTQAGEDTRQPIGWKRLPAGFQLPTPRHAVVTETIIAPPADDLAPVEFDWAGETIRRVGSVVHRFLQRISLDGPENWNEMRLQESTAAIDAALEAENIPSRHLKDARLRVVAALRSALASEKGRWLLDSAHENAESELRLSGLVDGRLTNAVLDRTFVDENGRRWIVDYKTSTHEGGDPGLFLDREVERYRSQLERYAVLIAGIEPDRPIHLGLYFPLLDGWRQWEFGTASAMVPS